MSVDQGLVRDMREEVADLLAQQRRDDATSGIPPMSPEDERQFARALIGRVLEQHARAEIAAGRSPLNAQEEDLAAREAALAATLHAKDEQIEKLVA